MQIKTFIVDAFTDKPFSGNPAGVCLPEKDLSDDLMLSIAKELGFSETAFVRPIKGSQFSIRYFSPKMEIPLCGHATLASSQVQMEKEGLESFEFFNIQGIQLPIRKASNGIIMQFPVYSTIPSVPSSKLLTALGITEIIHAEYNLETNILMLEIASPEELKNLRPDFNALYQSSDSINGVLVTAQANDDYDFHSRYFWPWSGTNEDPVTGGTHTFLAPYWSKRLGKTKLRSFQSSARTGYMNIEILNTHELLVIGQARIIFEGNLCL